MAEPIRRKKQEPITRDEADRRAQEIARLTKALNEEIEEAVLRGLRVDTEVRTISRYGSLNVHLVRTDVSLALGSHDPLYAVRRGGL